MRWVGTGGPSRYRGARKITAGFQSGCSLLSHLDSEFRKYNSKLRTHSLISKFLDRSYY